MQFIAGQAALAAAGQLLGVHQKRLHLRQRPFRVPAQRAVVAVLGIGAVLGGGRGLHAQLGVGVSAVELRP